METPYITNPPAPKDMDTAVALVESLALATSDPLPSTVSVSSLLGDSQRAEAKEVPGWNGLRFRLDVVIIWLLIIWLSWLIIWMRYDVNYRKHPKKWKRANPNGDHFMFYFLEVAIHEIHQMVFQSSSKKTNARY